MDFFIIELNFLRNIKIFKKNLTMIRDKYIFKNLIGLILLRLGRLTMFHKIKNVSALPDFKLSVQFSEGVTKIYDVKPLFEKIPFFATLKDQPEVFASVTVDVGGYGIVWNDELDLSCDELWENGVQVDTPFDGLLAFSDATELWGLNESTLRKAITYGKLVNGVDVCKFGKQWVVSIEAMKREYGNAGDRV